MGTRGFFKGTRANNSPWVGKKKQGPGAFSKGPMLAKKAATMGFFKGPRAKHVAPGLVTKLTLGAFSKGPGLLNSKYPWVGEKK